MPETVSDRIRAFLRESMEIGIPAYWAKTIATVSINESGSTFGIPRVSNVLPVECYPTRQILILEEGNPFLNNLQEIPLPTSWLDDPEIADLLQDMGWRNGNQASNSLAAYDTLGSPNSNLAGMFDFLMDRRKYEALGAFSVGPTQTYLRYAGFNGGNSDLFPSFDDLWRFWTSTTTRERYDSHAWDYLDTNFRLTDTLRVCGSAQNGCIELWLQNHQTGARDWSSTRHAAYARNFAENRDLVSRLARELSYT
jgi:hypothetical protein